MRLEQDVRLADARARVEVFRSEPAPRPEAMDHLATGLRNEKGERDGGKDSHQPRARRRGHLKRRRARPHGRRNQTGGAGATPTPGAGISAPGRAVNEAPIM